MSQWIRKIDFPDNREDLYGWRLSARMEYHGQEEGDNPASPAGDTAKPAPAAPNDLGPTGAGNLGDASDEGAQGYVEIIWPSVEDVLDISRQAVDNYQGVRDLGGLESAVNSARMQYEYGGVEDPCVLAAYLAHGIQRQQALVEGNKRTGAAAAVAFLKANGFSNADRITTASDAPTQILALAEGHLSPEQLGQWFHNIVSLRQSSRMIIEATAKDADMRLDGMLAYRVQLAGQITSLDPKLYKRIVAASLTEAERVCIVGQYAGKHYLFYDHAPILNLDKAYPLDETETAGIAAYPAKQAGAERHKEAVAAWEKANLPLPRRAL